MLKVLSLFDGISCARVALDRAGYKNITYYASEIDKYAIQIARKNWPDTIQLGDVRNIKGKDLPKIDLMILGSPCQDLSIAKKERKGLEGERSGLFWEAIRIHREITPKHFVYENVNSMKQEWKDQMLKAVQEIDSSAYMIMINASLVSAQNRKRIFITNIRGVNQPKDKGILLKDILEQGTIDKEKSYCIDANYFKGGKIGGTHQSSTRNYTIRIGQIGRGGQGDRIYSPEGKGVSLSANGGGRGAKTGLYAISKPVILGDEPLQVLKEGRTELGKQSRRDIRRKTGKDSTFRSKGHKAYFGREGVKANCITTGLGAEGMIVEDFIIRKLTPIECERLQSLPDNYTEGVSNTQRYKALGNAFNVEVVKHILSFIKQ